MARGKTLIALLDDLRSETRNSSNPAHNQQVRDSQVKILQRTQEWLWEDFTWPHLRVERRELVQIGQRYYAPPADIRIDRIENIDVFLDGRWSRLTPGIDDSFYTAHNSDRDERAWPPRRWRIHENEQIEIWPIADQVGDAVTLEGQMKITGIRDLRSLVQDGDRVDLDDRVIVLFAAAEMLAATGAKDAQLKQDIATRRLAKLKGNLSPQPPIRMFGVGERAPPRRFSPHYRPPGS